MFLEKHPKVKVVNHYVDVLARFPTRFVKTVYRPWNDWWGPNPKSVDHLAPCDRRFWPAKRSADLKWSRTLPRYSCCRLATVPAKWCASRFWNFRPPTIGAIGPTGPYRYTVRWCPIVPSTKGHDTDCCPASWLTTSSLTASCRPVNAVRHLNRCSVVVSPRVKCCVWTLVARTFPSLHKAMGHGPITCYKKTPCLLSFGTKSDMHTYLSQSTYLMSRMQLWNRRWEFGFEFDFLILRLCAFHSLQQLFFQRYYQMRYFYRE